MNRCRDLQSFMAGMLEGERLAEFQAHLQDCPRCQKMLEIARDVDRRISMWIEQRNPPTTTPARAARLVALARYRGSGLLKPRRAVRVALAAACLTAVVAVALQISPFEFQVESRSSRHGPRDDGGRATSVVVEERPRLRVLVSSSAEIDVAAPMAGQILSVHDQGRLLFEIGRDLIGLGPRGRMEIVDARGGLTRLRLLRGGLAVDAEPRRGNGTFEVEAGGYVVRVVGTRFQVSLDPNAVLAVGVISGEVAVVEPDGKSHAVHPGRSLEIDRRDRVTSARLSRLQYGEIEELLSNETYEEIVEPERTGISQERAVRTDEPVPWLDLGEVRKWILEGRYREADQALVAYLADAPAHAAAWSLLADCRRKAGKWSGAVAAHRRVIDLGNPGASNRARFMAAVLLQDRLADHMAAAVMLQAYLERDKSLRPLQSEAMFRLARAYLRLGRGDKARVLLEEIVERHGGTTAAVQSHRLLSTMDEE